MNTLAEVEQAAQALAPEQKVELFRFLAAQLCHVQRENGGALLVPGPDGTLLLQAPPGAPPMTTETIKQMLADFP